MRWYVRSIISVVALGAERVRYATDSSTNNTEARPAVDTHTVLMPRALPMATTAAISLAAAAHRHPALERHRHIRLPMTTAAVAAIATAAMITRAMGTDEVLARADRETATEATVIAATVTASAEHARTLLLSLLRSRPLCIRQRLPPRWCSSMRLSLLPPLPPRQSMRLAPSSARSRLLLATSVVRLQHTQHLYALRARWHLAYLSLV